MEKKEYLTEFLQKQYSEQQNYDEILKKIKGGKDMRKRKILNIAAVLLIVIIVSVMSPNIYAQIKWRIEYKEYQQREINYGSATINQAVKDYEQNIFMDYIYKEDIGVKINSLIITNDYFKMDVDFKIPESIEINTDTFSYGFAVYDENNKIYGVSNRITVGRGESDYWRKLYEELDIKYDKKDVFAVQLEDSAQTGVESSTRGNIIASTAMTSNVGFPNSRKLYIRIFDIGYNLIEFNEQKTDVIAVDDVNITDAEWNIEVEIPEEFYNRQTIELKMNEDVEGVELTKAELTETGLTVKVKLEGLVDAVMEGRNKTLDDFNNDINQRIHIEDEAGNVYNNINLGTTEQEGEVKMKFNISKKDLEKGLILCVKVRDKEHRINLINI